MNRQRILMAAAALLILTTGWASAADEGAGVELRSVVEVEVRTENPDGTVTSTRTEAKKVVPGDEVIFTMHFHNRGGEPADDVVITNPVPRHMTLLRADGTAAGSTIEFSVDGGQFYDALARLQVTGEDGLPRPAAASDCTHLRWVFTRPLDPDEAGQVSFVAQLQ